MNSMDYMTKLIEKEMDSFSDFFDAIVKGTESGFHKWFPVFEDEQFWDYYACQPKMRSKIKNRYLYAIFEKSIQTSEIYIKELYCFVKGEPVSLMETEFEPVNGISSDYQSEMLLELSNVIIKIYGNPFDEIQRNSAICRINLLNDIYDALIKKTGKCIVDGNGIEYNSFYIFIDKERIYITEKKKKGFVKKYFNLYKEEIDKHMKIAFGDIPYNENDKRFINLFDLKMHYDQYYFCEW